MPRVLVLVYGVTAYLVFLGSFLYAIGFVGNVVVPKSIDSGPAGPWGAALAVNALLLGLFAIQHSVMARPGFKARWTRVVARPLERSTYVLLASLILFLLFAQWRPMPEVIWDVTGAVATGLSALSWLGWLMVFSSTVLIGHTDLFGLRQVWMYFRGQVYTGATFGTPGWYRWIRHPIMLGFGVAFWATPRMTQGHLLFAVATTGYILLGIWLEERDLLAHFGETYRTYRRQTGMVFPWRRGPG